MQRKHADEYFSFRKIALRSLHYLKTKGYRVKKFIIIYV